MAPWTLAAAYECATSRSMDPWAATKKALQYCGGDTSSCPGPFPMVACVEFHVRSAENFSVTRIVSVTVQKNIELIFVYYLFSHRSRAFLSCIPFVVNATFSTGLVGVEVLLSPGLSSWR